MIYTITTNPAIDYYMIVDKPLMEDEVNRSAFERYKAAGKGLNVSGVLQLFGVKSKAITVVGGFTGQFIADNFKNNEYIDFIGIEVEGDTRINCKIFGTDKCYCVNGNGPAVTEDVKVKILDILKDAKKDDYVMLCGKMAKGLDDSFIHQIADVVNSKQAKLVIDMESVNESLIRKCHPYLIKPNLYELGLMMGKTEIQLSELQNVCKEVLSWGVDSILVSLGKDGAYYTDGEQCFKVNQPEFTAINKVGCGDAMLASFIGKLADGTDKQQALKYATAAGCAQAATLDEITLKDIESFVEKMSIEK